MSIVMVSLLCNSETKNYEALKQIFKTLYLDKIKLRVSKISRYKSKVSPQLSDRGIDTDCLFLFK